MTRPPLPEALVPAMAIFSAPPAVSGNAWFAMNGGQTDLVEQALLGAFVFLLGTTWCSCQVTPVSRFSPGWWALTFTAAASATYVVR